MRNLRNPRLERGEVRIEDIELDFKSRDDIPVKFDWDPVLYSQRGCARPYFCTHGRVHPSRR